MRTHGQFASMPTAALFGGLWLINIWHAAFVYGFAPAAVALISGLFAVIAVLNVQEAGE